MIDLDSSTHNSPQWLVEIDVEKGLTTGRARGARGIWESRGVLFALVARDMTSRYRRTVLGALWAIVQPAAFTIIISLRHKAGPAGSETIPYPVYVYSGFLIWTFFSTALQSASHSVVGAQGLVSASYFPRHVLPWAAVGVHLLDIGVGIVGLGALMAIYQVPPSPRVLLLPVVVALIALVAGGVGSFLAGLIVIFRDVSNITPFLSLAWLFATPALYTQTSIVSNSLIKHGGVRYFLTVFNPLAGLLDLVRYCTFGQSLAGSQIALTMGVTIVVVFLGHKSFARFESRFTDVI